MIINNDYSLKCDNDAVMFNINIYIERALSLKIHTEIFTGEIT